MSELRDDLAALKIERAPEKIRTGGRWVVWVVTLLVLAAGGYAVYAFATREKPVPVEVGTVSLRAAGGRAQVLTGNGYVTARRRATVSSKITGKVIEVNVEEGKAVTQGQILARLDDSTSRAALALAEAQADSARRAVNENDVRLAEAKVTLTRLASLLKDGIVTQAEVDGAKANVDSIDARIMALKTQVLVAERQIALQQTDLDNSIIRAPFSGIAISKDAQPGEMVSPVSAGGGFTRTGICTIVDMKSLEIEVDVNETYIDRVRPNQDVLATLNAYPEWQVPAHVITTIPAGDRQKATVLVRIGFNQLDPRILPDMGVKVSFLRQEDSNAQVDAAAAQPMTLAPKAALKIEGANTYAFVVNGDVVERRAVTTGGTDGDRIEVKAGLRSGDRVVMSPPPALANGMKVLIK